MNNLKQVLTLSIGFSCSLLLNAQTKKRLIDEVNPFIGTSNFGTTNPGAVVPNGLMSITPLNGKRTLVGGVRPTLLIINSSQDFLKSISAVSVVLS